MRNRLLSSTCDSGRFALSSCLGYFGQLLDLYEIRDKICKAAQIEASRQDGAWSDLPHSSMLVEEVGSISIILAFPAEVLSDSHLSSSQC